MSQPPSPNRWTAGLDRARAAARRAARPVRGNARRWLAAGLGLAVLIGAGVWLNSLTTPVVRAGTPTASIAPLPVRTTAAPTPVASPSGTPTPEPTVAVPELKSSGKFKTSGRNIPAVSTSGDLRRFAVRVETSARLKADQTAVRIAEVLNDPRSWAGSGSVRFELVADPGKAAFTITLASARTAGKQCRLDAVGTCATGTEVVVDAGRWQAPAPEYAGAAADWRAYLTNHALGHLLGERHAGCGKQAKPAPVMMPQAGDLGGCRPNPWPYP